MTEGFELKFTTTNSITAALARIERARGFLEAATLSEQWVREMGERDIMVKEHGLSERQSKVLWHVLVQGRLTIQDVERLCSDANRRTLQRDLKAMVEKGILESDGATNKLFYRLRKKGP